MTVKRFLAILLVIFSILSLVACDFTHEGESSLPSSTSSASTSETSDNTSSKPVNDTSDQNTDSSADESGSDIGTVTITDVNVRITGSDALNESGLRISGDFNMSIDVTVEGKKEVISSLLASDISAFVDVSGISDKGDVECMIFIELPDNVTLVSTSASYATLKIKEKTATVVDPPVSNDAYISNGIIISGTRGMEQFGGGAESGKLTAEKLNQFKAAVGDSVNVYVLAAPLASAFYAPSKYPNSIAAHRNCFGALSENLVGVKYVDALSALSEHADEDIYARTDHHWNALGAYYAAKELSAVAGTPFDDLSTFTSQSVDGVVGSLYTYSKAEVLKNNPDTFTWYVPTRNHTVVYYSRDKYTNPVTGRTLFSTNNGYTKFIYGDSYITNITSNVGNGRKLLLFKDSYGNALAPFLVSQFDEVIIADFRYFGLSTKQFIADHGITDVCFSLSAFAVAGKSRNYITSVL